MVAHATQPTFETRRLRLRPRTLADTDACIAMDLEPGVTRYVAGPWGDPAAHRAFVEARTMGPYAPGLGYWVISPLEEPAQFLGWVLLIPVNGRGPQVEIGWRLRREAWGFGFATEAAMAVLRHGLEGLGLAEIVADIHPDNSASRRVAEKLGFALREVVHEEAGPLLRYSRRNSFHAAGLGAQG